MAEFVVVARYRRRLLFFTSLYLLLIIVTWVLTCLLAQRPFLLVQRLSDLKDDLEVHGIRQKEADIATRFSYALDALTYVAALLALPVIYAILARATVVYSMRTSKNKSINLGKLFALADGRFISTSIQSLHESHNSFPLWAALLLLLAFAQPIVRAVTVDTAWNQFPLAGYVWHDGTRSKDTLATNNGWSTTQVGGSPDVDAVRAVKAAYAIERTRNAIIGTESRKVLEDSWHDEKRDTYFQTSLPQGIDTGLLRQVGLRLDTVHDCYEMKQDEYPSKCQGAEFPYRHPNMTVDICVTGAGTGRTNNMGQIYHTPWLAGTYNAALDDSSDNRDLQYRFEEVYIRANSTLDTLLGFRCRANTTLAYFELPSALNNQTCGDRIVDYSLYVKNGTTGDASSRGEEGETGYTRAIEERQDSNDEPGWGSPYEVIRDTSAPGPLMTVALALFGEGSFYALAQRLGKTNETRTRTTDPYATVLSETCPYPFKFWYLDPGSRGYNLNDVCGAGYESWANNAVLQMLRWISLSSADMSYYSTYLNDGSPMEAALFFANRIILDEALGSLDRTPPIPIYLPETLPFRQFEVSTPALIACSVLISLQVLIILGFLCYAYKVPTWTDTLDSLAIARITHQLQDNGLLRGIGLREMDTKEQAKLDKIDGLIGLEEPPIPLEDMSSTAAATTAADGASSLVSGSSSTSHVNTLSHHTNHSQPQLVRVDDPSMGMSSIPIDVQTVVSEDFVGDERRPNNINTTTTNLDTNPSNISIQNNTLHPRISLDIGEQTLNPNDHDHDHDHEARNSPPAYTPRTAEGGALEPPPYATALSVNELRVGAQGLVTRRLPRTRKNIWV